MVRVPTFFVSFGMVSSILDEHEVDAVDCIVHATGLPVPIAFSSKRRICTLLCRSTLTPPECLCRSSRVLNFAQRIPTTFESCLVAASLRTINPFLQSPLADMFRDM